MKGFELMKKSILQKLYDGEIYPSENIVINTPEYRKAIKALTDEKECFLKTLSENSLEIYQNIERLQEELTKIYSYADFSHGFRLAVALIFDLQDDTDNQ
jgi:predicted S18 family serine protease